MNRLDKIREQAQLCPSPHALALLAVAEAAAEVDRLRAEKRKWATQDSLWQWSRDIVTAQNALAAALAPLTEEEKRG